MITRTAITIFLMLVASSIQASSLHGKVIRIADGDTLTILVNSEQVKIRLAGIDTPEKAQPFGNKAKQLLTSLTFKKSITINVKTKDKYGRTVGAITVDRLDVNAEMVRQGMA